MIMSQMTLQEETDELCRAVQQPADRKVCLHADSHIHAHGIKVASNLVSELNGVFLFIHKYEDSEQPAGTTASRTGKCQAFKSIARHFACWSRDYWLIATIALTGYKQTDRTARNRSIRRRLVWWTSTSSADSVHTHTLPGNNLTRK
jgi:hypothetical protein